MIVSVIKDKIRIGKDLFAITGKDNFGNVIFGPYFRAYPGNYDVEFGICSADLDVSDLDSHVATVDISANEGRDILSCKKIMARDIHRAGVCIFKLKIYLKFDAILEFRVHVTGACDLAIRLKRVLRSENGDTFSFPESTKSALDCGPQDIAPSYGEFFSKYFSLNQSIIDHDGALPLFWSSGHHEGLPANLGDALSPVVIAALSGLRPYLVGAAGPEPRLLSAGTILHWQREGEGFIWGSGLDPVFDCDNQPLGYKKPDQMRFRAHAVRGPLTRKILVSEGVYCPEVYGDPGWLLPKIVEPASEKKFELGIIPSNLHFREWSTDAELRDEYAGFNVDDNESVRVISTLHEPTWEGFVDKIHEITSCKRVISSSFHGLIIPQAYGIPSVGLFPYAEGGLFNADLASNESQIDFRMRDFLLGAGCLSSPFYAQHPETAIKCDDVIRQIDRAWEPLEIDIEPFLQSFPLERLPPDEIWQIPADLIQQIIF